MNVRLCKLTAHEPVWCVSTRYVTPLSSHCTNKGQTEGSWQSLHSSDREQSRGIEFLPVSIVSDGSEKNFLSRSLSVLYTVSDY